MVVRMTWEQRAEVVAAWRASGKPASEIAAAQGISRATLLWWARELRAREAKKFAGSPKVTLARVVRAAEHPTSARGFSVSVGRARIEVSEGFDAKLLREVVAALAAGAS